MSAAEAASIILLAAVVAGGVAALMVFRRQLRTQRLRTRFGVPEYARAVEDTGSRKSAEDELDARKRRVEGFHIRPLASGERARFAESWRRIEARFFDSPAGAVTEADQLLDDVLSTRGYPCSSYGRRAADISVDHPVVLTHYRAVHDIELGLAQGKAATEELRLAMLHYRALFDELVCRPEMAHVPATGRDMLARDQDTGGATWCEAGRTN
jgi:hypothetical protein